MTGSGKMSTNSFAVFGPDREGRIGRSVKVDVTNTSATPAHLLRFDVQYVNADGALIDHLQDLHEAVRIDSGATITVVADEGPGWDQSLLGSPGSSVTARIGLVAFARDVVWTGESEVPGDPTLLITLHGTVAIGTTNQPVACTILRSSADPQGKSELQVRFGCPITLDASLPKVELKVDLIDDDGVMVDGTRVEVGVGSGQPAEMVAVLHGLTAGRLRGSRLRFALAAYVPMFDATCSATTVPDAIAEQSEAEGGFELAWDDDEPDGQRRQDGKIEGTLFRIMIARIRPDYSTDTQGNELSFWGSNHDKFVDRAGNPCSDPLITLEVFRWGEQWVLNASMLDVDSILGDDDMLPFVPKRYAGDELPAGLANDIFDVLEACIAEDLLPQAIRTLVVESFEDEDGPDENLFQMHLEEAGGTVEGHGESDILRFEANEADQFAGGLLLEVSYNTDFPFDVAQDGTPTFDHLDEGVRRQFIYACTVDGEERTADDESDASSSGTDSGDGARDPLFGEAVQVCLEHQAGSTSLLHDSLGVGYGRAARLIEQLHEAGILGPANGSKPRVVLVGMRNKSTESVSPPRAAVPPAVPTQPQPSTSRAPRLVIIGPMLLLLAAGLLYFRPWAITGDVATTATPAVPELASAAPPIPVTVDMATLFPAQPNGYVTDAANLLDAEIAAVITSRLDTLQRVAGAEVVVVTLGTVGDQSLESVAAAIASAWAVGTKVPVGAARRDLGVVVLLVPTSIDENGPVWIEAGAPAREMLGPTFRQELRDAIAPALQARRYGEALDIATQVLMTRLSSVGSTRDSTAAPDGIR